MRSSSPVNRTDSVLPRVTSTLMLPLLDTAWNPLTARVSSAGASATATDTIQHSTLKRLSQLTTDFFIALCLMFVKRRSDFRYVAWNFYVNFQNRTQTANFSQFTNMFIFTYAHYFCSR